MIWFGRGFLRHNDLRKQLFDAAARDAREFVKLVERHEAKLLEHAFNWIEVPEQYRAAMGWYEHGLAAVAQELARRGHPELAERLQFAVSPTVNWEKGLEYVHRCRAEGNFHEGTRVARAILKEVRNVRGDGVDEHLLSTYAMLSDCLFHSGDVDAARSPLEEALALLEKARHSNGVASCLERLYEIERYRGQSEAAANALQRLTGVLEAQGRTSLARACGCQAEIVRRGEPLCRVVCEIAGERFEVDQLPAGLRTFQAQFIVARNRIALGVSDLAVQQGVQLANAGDLRAAIDLFERAGTHDRFNPAPHYHRGVALLHVGRFAEAAEALAVTDVLAPGYFHVRSDRWFAECLRTGELRHDTFLLVRHLQDGAAGAEEVVKLAAAAVRSTPIAPLYLAGGDALRRLERDHEAERWYRDGLRVAEEPDVRTRLLIALGSLIGDSDERVELLKQAVELRGNLVAAAMAQLALHSTQSEERPVH